MGSFPETYIDPNNARYRPSMAKYLLFLSIER